MSIIKWNPLLNPFNRWPDIWENESFSDLMSSQTNNLDIYETDDQVIVKANVAGVSSQDIDLTFEKGTLWIKASKQTEDTDENKKHYKQSSWSYSYKIAVPGQIDVSKEPEAELEDGVLTIKFHKAEASKPKKLKIKAKNK